MNNYENYENYEDDQSTEHEAGQLLINQNAIQDGQIDRTNLGSIGHEIAPFLFLDNMTAVEEQRVRQNIESLTSTRDQVFLNGTIGDGFDTNEFVATLFQDEEARTSINIGGGQQIAYFSVPVWIIVTGGVIAVVFLTFLAIILGQKFAGTIHKNKAAEDGVNG